MQATANKLTKEQLQDHYYLGNTISNIFKLFFSEYGLRRFFSIICILMKDEPIEKSNEGLTKLTSSIMMFNQPMIANQVFQNVEFQKKAFILPFAAVYDEVIKYLVIVNKDGSYERDAEGKVYVSEDPTNWFNFIKGASTLLVETFEIKSNFDESNDYIIKQFFDNIKKDCPRLLKEIKNLVGMLCDVNWNI
jgi:hypothetical protein